MVKIDITSLGEIYVVIYPEEEGIYNEKTRFKLLINCSTLNVAVATHRLGCVSSILGSIGDDIIGSFIVSVLRGEGVITNWLKVKKLRTTIAFSIRDKYGEKLLFYRKPYVKTADTEFTLKDVNVDEVIDSTKTLYVSGFSICRSPLKDTVFYVMKNASRKGIDIVFSTTSLKALSKPCEEFISSHSRYFKYATVLYSKVDELEPLFKSRNYKFIANKLMEKYDQLKYVIINYGRGVYIRSRDIELNKEFRRLEIVDLSGADDAWISGFMVFHMVKGMGLEKTVSLSNTSYVMTCSKPGVLNAFPQIYELEKYVNKEKINS